MVVPPFTAEYLRSILDYYPEIGEFYWRERDNAPPWVRRKLESGEPAGNIHQGRTPYIEIRIDGKKYKAHNLAWFWMTGEWPENLVDHKDTDGLNNIWTNLRQATNSQNNQNSNRYKNNKSGYKGVCWDNGCWRAYINVNKKRFNLGWFSTPEEAHQAYCKAALEHFGEFARAA
jgi:hypothetical protein